MCLDKNKRRCVCTQRTSRERSVKCQECVYIVARHVFLMLLEEILFLLELEGKRSLVSKIDIVPEQMINNTTEDSRGNLKTIPICVSNSKVNC